MQFVFRNCTHILTRTQGKTFEDMFLVKITSKGTSLRGSYGIDNTKLSPHKNWIDTMQLSENFPAKRCG